MTEQEWLACDEPQRMLDVFRATASDRKLRLFAVGCCRCIWHLLPDRRSRKAVEASERFADGLITPEKLNFVRGDARRAANVATRKSEHSESVRWIVAHLTEQDKNQVLGAVWPAAYFGGRQTQHALQCALVRDIFGNPFRAVIFNVTWQNANVVWLAQAIYDERAFDRMPILGDALEEAGCDNADILNHCREPGEHVRGCWVVDLLLGKS
jgi:hypothetical protein